jgi:hypothetical protein
MKRPNYMYLSSLIGCLVIPGAVDANTINLFASSSGYTALPGQASSVALEHVPTSPLASLEVLAIITMETHGKPTTVHLHSSMQDEENDFSGVISYSQEFPAGVLHGTGASPVSTVPLPGAGWLLMTGIIGMTMAAGRRSKKGGQTDTD